ncbi:MAG: GlcNAc-PI de-N-acetylase [Verrucomicrobia bacterium TMED175]|nr:MAG: GlcNAc-PI de-N-acetylase [Verrucomicrobia bacterium TMED175]
MNKKVLVVVAHSDDETISMGGTIKKHFNLGDIIYVMSMTDGISSRDNSNENEILIRKNSAKKASSILGFEWTECFDFKDNAMDSHPLLEIVKSIEKVKKIFNPDLVYTHSVSDLNIDHNIVSRAVLTAFRPTPEESCKEIRLFEVSSSTDFGVASLNGSFNPNLFIDIKDTWDSKQEALKAYSSEIRAYPHSRSIEGIKNLAKNRGNQVGYELVEAFEVVRKIED